MLYIYIYCLGQKSDGYHIKTLNLFFIIKSTFFQTTESWMSKLGVLYKYVFLPFALVFAPRKLIPGLSCIFTWTFQFIRTYIYSHKGSVVFLFFKLTLLNSLSTQTFLLYGRVLCLRGADTGWVVPLAALSSGHPEVTQTPGGPLRPGCPLSPGWPTCPLSPGFPGCPLKALPVLPRGPVSEEERVV